LKKKLFLFQKMENVIMKFKDAPIGARFNFIGDDMPKDIYVKINDYDDGLVVKWDGNIQGHQSHCCWLDEENGIDFDTNGNNWEKYEIQIAK
jgi:hypothetical protein